MTDDDPGQPVQFYYIPDFTKEFMYTGIENQDVNPVSNVSQNYPNPATGETYIRVNLIQESSLQLSIYNLTGQMLKSIDFGTLTNGAHELKLSTKDLEEGLYFYTVKAGNNEVTKKMIVQ